MNPSAVVSVKVQIIEFPIVDGAVAFYEIHARNAVNVLVCVGVDLKVQNVFAVFIPVAPDNTAALLVAVVGGEAQPSLYRLRRLRKGGLSSEDLVLRELDTLLDHFLGNLGNMRRFVQVFIADHGLQKRLRVNAGQEVVGVVDVVTRYVHEFLGTVVFRRIEIVGYGGHTGNAATNTQGSVTCRQREIFRLLQLLVGVPTVGRGDVRSHGGDQHDGCFRLDRKHAVHNGLDVCRGIVFGIVAALDDVVHAQGANKEVASVRTDLVENERLHVGYGISRFPTGNGCVDVGNGAVRAVFVVDVAGIGRQMEIVSFEGGVALINDLVIKQVSQSFGKQDGIGRLVRMYARDEGGVCAVGDTVTRKEDGDVLAVLHLADEILVDVPTAFLGVSFPLRRVLVGHLHLPLAHGSTAAGVGPHFGSGRIFGFQSGVLIGCIVIICVAGDKGNAGAESLELAVHHREILAFMIGNDLTGGRIDVGDRDDLVNGIHQ